MNYGHRPKATGIGSDERVPARGGSGTAPPLSQRDKRLPGTSIAIVSWLNEFVLAPTSAENVVPEEIVPSAGWYE